MALRFNVVAGFRRSKIKRGLKPATTMLLIAGFVIVFAAGITCSVICPERLFAPDKNARESGPCTDWTSTDFTAGNKISPEKITLNATPGLVLDSFTVSSLRHISFPVFVSTHTFLDYSPHTYRTPHWCGASFCECGEPPECASNPLRSSRAAAATLRRIVDRRRVDAARWPRRQCGPAFRVLGGGDLWPIMVLRSRSDASYGADVWRLSIQSNSVKQPFNWR